MKKLNCFVCLIALSMLLSSCYYGGNVGVKAYRNGDYSTAYEKFQRCDKLNVGMDIIETYYYAKTSEMFGNPDKANSLKIDVYNEIARFSDRGDKLRDEIGSTEYDEFMEWGKELARQQRFNSQKDKAIEGALYALQNFAKNPSSVEILKADVIDGKSVGSKNYYLVKTRASATNSFGATVSNWYIIEVIVDSNGDLYSRDNLQQFDYEPSSNQIDLCKSIFGW